MRTMSNRTQQVLMTVFVLGIFGLLYWAMWDSRNVRAETCRQDLADYRTAQDSMRYMARHGCAGVFDR